MSNSAEDRRIDREIHSEISGSDPFAAAVRATRMPMLITDPRLPDNPIVFVNDAFLRFTGYGRDEVLGRNCRFLQGAATSRDDVTRIRDSIARRVPIEIDLLNYKKNGDTFWNRLLISPVFDNDELTYFFASQFDISPERNQLSRLSTDRDALETDLINRVMDLGAAEERLGFALRAGRLGAWTLDIASGRLVASSIFRENFGYRPADSIAFDELSTAIAPEDRDRWKDAVAHAMAGDGDLDVEFRVLGPNGQRRWLEVRAQVRMDSAGHPMTLSGVSLEVTQRKAAEMHRDLLTRELSHRVKNTLANVQSIVSQSLRGADVPDTVGAQVSQRLQALAGAHDVLTNEGWQGADIAQIVANAITPFSDDAHPRIAAGGPRVNFSSTAATALSLALHELATNAVKYGALSLPNGRVTLNWSVEGPDFALTWTEIGGPTVAQPTRRGFGSRMIERALAASINGQAKVDYRPSGLVFTMTTQLANLAEPGVSERSY